MVPTTQPPKREPRLGARPVHQEPEGHPPAVQTRKDTTVKLRITIDMNNESFGDNHYSRGAEVATVLDRISRRLVEGTAVLGLEAPIHDSNGNTVGTMTIKRR